MCLYLQEVNHVYVRKGDLEANAQSLVEEVGFLKTLYEEVTWRWGWWTPPCVFSHTRWRGYLV